MDALFRIETDRVVLTWSKARSRESRPLAETTPPLGRLIIRKRRDGLIFEEDTWRADVPNGVTTDPAQVMGPRLYEQTDYKLFARSKLETRVAIVHQDPLIWQDLSAEDGGKIVHGYINFGSQVGRSEFSVLVDGHPEFDFEVEVFPTKLDYVSDYKQLLAEVQEILTGLALAYLRSTFQSGFTSSTPQPTHLEWLILLRHIVTDLEQALQQVAQQPIRSLMRETVNMRAERVRRIDSAVRSAVRRGKGSGDLIKLKSGLMIRQWMEAKHSHSTLDTPEHRWLALQLDLIRRRIGQLRREESTLNKSKRRDQTLHELDVLKDKIVRLSRLEPLASAVGDPPAGFASMQLLAAPGYREAYQACLVLSLGLRLEGGPVHMSVKDLNLLYEYWCYLALLRLIAEETGRPIPIKELFTIKQRGLYVLLQKGQESAVRFDTGVGRIVEVTYNPLFRGNSVLIPQRPDIMITFNDPNWPILRLVLDAKYRVDMSPEYRKQYLSPGPPQDALNVLHRYRDAILEDAAISQPNNRPKRTIIQAAAVFPDHPTPSDAFYESKLWQSLDRLGVGAIPLLPGNTEYLRMWLKSALLQGGWALADRATSHLGWEQAQDWRIAASEPVLVGILRPGQEEQHFAWIEENQLYYMPLLKTQSRQYVTKWVAIYSPVALHQPGAVTHYAPVKAVEVVSRKEIPTPWPSQRDMDELHVMYRLGQIKELKQPIENIGLKGRGQRFSIHRWTSRLGLDRARVLTELLLETEPEWRLYENLQARNIKFHLEPGPITVRDPDDPRGRIWFVTDQGIRVRYAGSAGFMVRRANNEKKYIARAEDVAKVIHSSDQKYINDGIYFG